MKNKLITVGILLAIVIMSVSYVSSKYNNLVTLTNESDKQWAQVDTVLQRRFDTINGAIGGLKISNKSEQDAIQKITDARKIYTAANGNTEAQVAAANNYGGALNGLLLSRSAIGEAYPNLKTPELVGGLIGGANIEGSENRVAVERQRYNDVVKSYNDAVTLFPANLFAKAFGFTKKSYFEVTSAESKNAPAIAPNLNF